MISFRPYGRLGNVLFMMGNAIAYALKHDEPFSAPYETDNPFWNPLYLPHLIDRNYIQGIEDVLVNENGFRHQDIPFEEHWKGKQIVLNGYWQSWKYIEDYRREILYAFDLRWLMKPNTASIHVRRGDYLQLTDKHPPYSLDYLNEAINYLINEKGVTNFEVYSDDTLWCLDNLTHIQNVKVMETGNELNDLVEASCCEHNICCSSTFSFFIAWLNRNPDKVCIFPKLWFVEGYHLDTQDLLHPDFIKM
jgi:hypothetical protein